MDYFPNDYSNHFPERNELKSHAMNWAESQNHDKDTVVGYAEWYADFHDGTTWASCTPHRSAIKKYATWVEQETLRNLHPSRRQIANLRLVQGLSM